MEFLGQEILYFQVYLNLGPNQLSCYTTNLFYFHNLLPLMFLILVCCYRDKLYLLDLNLNAVDGGLFQWNATNTSVAECMTHISFRKDPVSHL